ncbi:MAG: hypothetical protein BYD32DRAFT_420537 [Podila humilis]|nr:MAG: hypothetical protein BYD32DRAFT_420537 [Podila humilis]
MVTERSAPVYVSTAKPKSPLTQQEIEEMKKNKVLIVGAGLGGITLGIFLEKAGIPYEIYERAKVVKPLGSALAIGPNVLLAFKQIGIYDEFIKLGKRIVTSTSYNDDIVPEAVTNWSTRDPLGGENTYIIARPLLYELLLRKIPPHKIHVGKRVLSILQNDNGVLIRCSDNMTHHGDILVGADGAYSGVRQSLYAQMKKQNLLPKSDSGVLPFTCTCLVGQTDPLDPAEFPEVEEEHCRFSSVVGDKYPYSRVTFTSNQNTICWMLLHYLDKNTAKDNDAFRNSEWGPEAAEQMCKEVAHLPIPGGNGKLTMKDLIDRTPKDLISKVMLEEKLFKTWHHRRTVLLGDACYKMHPAAGLGAVNAMQDAIVLSSLISSLSTKDERDITGIFKAYREERRPLAESSYKMSHTLSKKIEKSVQGAIVRYTMKHMPAWLNKITLSKMVESRPQLSFLPRAEDNGTIKAMYQPSLHRKPAFSFPDNATPAVV